MAYVLDTHALAWFIDGDPRLGARSRQLISDPAARLIVPVMVLVELIFLWERQEQSYNYRVALDRLAHCAAVEVLPIGMEELDHLPLPLNIHDALIVASALAYAARSGEAVTVLTKDERIAGCGLVETAW